MSKTIKYYITSFLLCFAILHVATVSAQSIENTLQHKVAQNYKLYKANIDKAFAQMDELLIEASKSGDTVSELVLLDRMCRYHYSKNDVNKLIDASERLRNKAILYKNSNFEAMSHVYMAEAYTTNLLTKKALAELDKAMYVLDNNPAPDVKTFYARSNVLISQASLYGNQGKHKEAVKRIKMAVQSYPGKKGSNSYNAFQHVNYSNLGDIYIKFNKDSAFYYATQSIKLLQAEQTDEWIMATNYYVIGKVYQLNKDDDSALKYFLMADKITKDNGEATNTADLYNSLIDIYSSRGDSVKVEEYKDKLKEHELFVLKSKYSSLQKVMSKEKTEKPTNDNNLALFLGSGLLLVTILIAGFIVYNRRKKLKIPSGKDHVISNIEYDLLLEMIKKDDSSFIYTFEKLYPDFSKKLLAACPQLVQTEVEFCALLKMKLSTKQIAQLTYIETRTVQNKKHRIRKKLNLPADVDIYHWFDSI